MLDGDSRKAHKDLVWFAFRLDQWQDQSTAWHVNCRRGEQRSAWANGKRPAAAVFETCQFPACQRPDMDRFPGSIGDFHPAIPQGRLARCKVKGFQVPQFAKQPQAATRPLDHGATQGRPHRLARR